MFLKSPFPTKKTFYYNFFPSKEGEEASKGRGFESGQGGVGRRVMVEIRDILPPPVVDPNTPWPIKKTLSYYEIDTGKLVLSWHDTFEYVLRYWSLHWANCIGLGLRVGVPIWDITQKNYTLKYDQINDVYLQMGGRDEFHLVCKALMRSRNLKVYDEIALYWDSDQSCFMFRLLM